MFGHQDDQSNQFQMPQPVDDAAANNQGMPPAPSMPPPVMPPVGGQGGDDTWQHPGTPLENDQPMPQMPPAQSDQPTDMPDPGPAPDQGDQSNQSDQIDQSDQGNDQEESVNLQNDPQPTNDQQPQQPDPLPATDDLMEIKQQALTQLSPLVDHLDQTPEEKFRTTMMMIQASDDQSMLHTAYEAAQNISDEKVRAQALLDVINEINYFTQHQPNAQ